MPKTSENKKPISRFKGFSAIIMGFLIVMLMSISTVSAMDWDNIKDVKETKGEAGYFDLEIYNSWIIPNVVKGAKLWSGTLRVNTPKCSNDCEAQTDITLYETGSLVDELIFKSLQKDGRWIEEDIRNYSIMLELDIYQIEVPEYSYGCIPNNNESNITEICDWFEDGVSYEDSPQWGEYVLGTDLPAGEYTVKLTGEKRPSRTVDWIYSVQGETLNEWATWGNISEGDDAEVILNSPEDNYVAGSSEVLTNCSANVTGGATLTNISLWSNVTGVWQINQTEVFVSASVRREFSTQETQPADQVGECQTFTIGTVGENIDQTPTIVSLKIYKTSGSGNIEIFIANITGGQPDEDKQLANVSVPLASMNSTDMWRNFTLSSTSELKAGQQYALCRNEGANNVPWRYYNLGSVYAGGSRWYGNGLTWTASATTDMGFAIYSGGGGTTSAIQEFNLTISEPTKWTCSAGDSDGVIGFAEENRTMMLDTISPTIAINVINPILYVDGENIQVNYTITDISLSTCWYEYDSLNTTFSCSSGVNNITNITSAHPNTAIKIWANDTFGNINSSSTSITWDTTAPNITIYNPIILENYGYIGLSQLLNISINETSLANKWYNYNGTNITIESSTSKLKQNQMVNDTASVLLEGRSNLVAFNTTISYSLKSVALKLNITTTGTLQIGIKQLAQNGSSTIGSYLALQNFTLTSTDNLTRWYNYTFTNSANLSSNTPYALILKNVSTVTGHWRHNTTALWGYEQSLDDEVSWGGLNALIGPMFAVYEGNLSNYTTVFINISRGTNQNLTVYANDTFGNLGFKNVSWSYRLFNNLANYTTPVISTANESFVLNLTYVSADWTNAEATITYNGTEYASTKNATTNNLMFSNILTVPQVTVITNTTLFWNISLTNATDTYYILTQTYPQEVHTFSNLNITINPCSVGFSPAFNFSSLFETNLTEVNFTSIDYNFQYGTSGNNSALVTSGTFTNIPSFNICINSTASYYAGYGEIQYSVTGYSPRRFYLFENSRITNSTINNNLYSLETTESTAFQITATDRNLNAYESYYISLLRWYPELNEYKVVDMGKTDSAGQTVLNVKTNDVDYRLGLYAPNGTLIKLLEPIRMVCQTTPCVYSLIVDLTELDLTTFLNIESSLTYDKNTSVFTYVFNDASQDTTEMNLSVWLDTGSSGSSVLCSTSSTSFTGVLVCDVSAYNGQFRAEVYRSASPPILIAQLLVSARTSLVDVEGGRTITLFIGLILVMVMALMGVVSPPLVVILGMVGMIPLIILGGLNYAVFMILGAIAGIVLHFMRRVGG